MQIIQFFVTWINCQVHFLTRDMSHSMKVNVSAQADYPHVGQDPMTCPTATNEMNWIQQVPTDTRKV